MSLKDGHDPAFDRPGVRRPSVVHAWPIKAKFYMKHLWEGGINVFINNLGHMTKMAAMPIYGKNPSKFFFSGTTGPISTKHVMKHRGLEYCVCKNYDLLMTLTCFTAKSPMPLNWKNC